MLLMPHELDPNLLDMGEDYEHRIYMDESLIKYCVVDAIDYPYLVRHAWCIKRCRAMKEYARRAVSVFEDGVRIKTISIYLHIEVMKRTGIPPPTPTHRKVDHRDGDTWNCKRSNLRWATDKMNNMNRFGRMAFQEEF